MNEIKDLEGGASVVSYDAQIIVFARVNNQHQKDVDREEDFTKNTRRNGELRICLVTGNY